MPDSVKALAGGPITATDGEIGRVVEVLFDDREWRVSYLVVDVYPSLPGRKVLVPRACIDRGQPAGSGTKVMLTRDQIKRGPAADTRMPVSRQYEEAAQNGASDMSDAQRKASESHLRSSAEVIGYSVHGPDGLIGHVDDLVLDDAAWRITAFLAGERRLPIGDVRGIDWTTREVRIAG